jgi:hypothetical protein
MYGESTKEGQAMEVSLHQNYGLVRRFERLFQLDFVGQRRT